jgi:signal transduction histidine kinase
MQIDDKESLLPEIQIQEEDYERNQKLLDLAQELNHLGMVAQDSHQDIASLKEQLHKAKLFMNMVIHDTRNPTTSIRVGLQLTINQLKLMQVFYKDYLKF